MPVWPEFSVTPMRSIAAMRSPPRSDRAAMLALRQWFVWSRTPTDHPSRAIYVVDQVLEALSERERAAVSLWPAGSADALIFERIGIAPAHLGELRFALLPDVGRRLLRRARSTRSDAGPMFDASGDDLAF